jgi:heme O synthase-like polyprenyltransferase
MRMVAKAMIVPSWILCGALAYAGNIAHRNISEAHADAVCRSVNDRTICDDRLRGDESFFAVWALVCGPMALFLSASNTGFYHAGFAWSRTNFRGEEIAR